MAETFEIPSGENTKKPVVVWIERAIIGWIFLFAALAPHSIAATQICWTAGLLLWVARYFLRPRQQLFRTPIDYLLLGFFILTTISSMLSYDSETSIGKLRAASLFTIVYLVSQNIRSAKLVRWLAITLIASCMVNVSYTMIQRAIGRGVKLSGLAAAGAMAQAGLHETDTILSVDGRRVSNPSDVVTDITTPVSNSDPATAKVVVYRFEALPTLYVERPKLAGAETPLARLGAAGWTRGRDWRATGFYSHYVTYAETLQLIASLAFGIFIGLKRRATLAGVLLALSIGGMCLALLLTVTRASALSFLVSATVIVLCGASRKTILVLSLCAIPLVIGGLIVLQQKRNVKFFDPNDGSITWRETVQREGLHLLLSKPRHLVVGVGMDSLKRHWREWGLFENNLPMGHMHSDFLQLALERGIPALVVWVLFLLVYARMLWRMVRDPRLSGRIERGITLGALGGLVGFVSSGIVHYNWGDSTVVMIFYFILGLTLVIERLLRLAGADLQSMETTS